MRKAIVTFGLFLVAAVTLQMNAQEEAAKVGGAEISFEKEVHDYGTIQKGANGECEFVFTNTGTEELLITKAQGSCGCTVPDWPREPIAPGKSAKIKVKYDTNRPGMINKTVTVTSNASTPVKVLRITGEVKTPPTEATPFNNSGKSPVNN